MIASIRTQSLSDFGKTVDATIERVSVSGEAEILTVNGEARAVLISPEVFDAFALEVDVAAIRRSIDELDAGKGRDATEFFDELRARLLKMKRDATNGTTQ